ncbi:MAG: hypothetical protein JKY15_02600 [Deltaproteobacteria bacterium]|nr:hypothetical protein [Deltaproteobacteria bacterium]
MSALSAKRIRKLLETLNEELKKQSVEGEIYLVGGAVMCLVFGARPSTADLDGYFAPSALLRAAAARVAEREHVDTHWLNDGVKGFLSPQGDFSKYLDLDHLKIMTATPEYLLAMKCLSARIGEEFHDLEDIRFLLRYLNIESVDQAFEVLTRYYPLERFPQKSIYILQEFLGSTTP